jgi:hypothetical protein
MAEQQKYPYTTVPGKLRDLLQKAPKIGIPEKLTVAWLKKAGWTSSNDPSMIPVLKHVGLLGTDGRPTDLWDAVRAQDAPNKARLADAVRKAYSDLFSLYPDAHRKDAEALRNFFRANTTAGDQAQTKMVQTFQVLIEFGDFDEVVPEDTGKGAAAASGADKKKEEHGKIPISGVPGMTLNVNIQLQLPATSDGEVYEKLFEAMRKHLMGLSETT